ncbi:MAG: DUF362 domain-containing protein [Promethearchaeota archaeon]
MKQDSRVSIWRDDSPAKAVKKSLELLQDEIIDSLNAWKKKSGNSRNVLIKPNLLSTNENYECNTSVEHCLAIAHFIKELGNFTIYIGDGTTYESNHQPSTFKALEIHGYTKYDDTWQLVDLHEDDVGSWFNIINLEGGPYELGISKLMMDSFLISAAKFKTHDVLGLTLGLKNLMGGLIAARLAQDKKIIKKGDVKGFMHGFSDKKPHKLTKEQNVGPSKVCLAANLVRLAKARLPDLTVIDGSIVMEGPGPRRGTACSELGGIVISGTDCIAVDSTCASIVKMPLDSFKYIKLAGEMSLGTHDIDEIKQVGLDWKELETSIKFHPKFKKAREWTREEINNLQDYLVD